MAVRTIEVRERVMARNDEIAAQVRRRLARAPAYRRSTWSRRPARGRPRCWSGRSTSSARSSASASSPATCRRRTTPTGWPRAPPAWCRRWSPTAPAISTRARSTTALDAIDLDQTGLLFIENVGNLVCPANWDLGEDGQDRALLGHRRRRQAAQVPRHVPEARATRCSPSPTCFPTSRSPSSARSTRCAEVNPGLRALPALGADRRGNGRVVRLPPRHGPRAPVPAGMTASRTPRRPHAACGSPAWCRASDSGPFVHRLAMRHGIAGSVRNVGGEVEIVVEGPAPAARPPSSPRIRPRRRRWRGSKRSTSATTPAAAARRLRHRRERSTRPAAASRCRPTWPSAPPAAPSCPIRPTAASAIRSSPAPTAARASPSSRRCRTIAQRTSMRRFTQCAACEREYRTPGDRRYHSETNSCPACGPRLWCESDARRTRTAAIAIAAAAALLARGGIVAVRGLGGFHLAVDARNDAAVAPPAPAEAPRRQAARGHGPHASTRRARLAHRRRRRRRAGSSRRPARWSSLPSPARRRPGAVGRAGPRLGRRAAAVDAGAPPAARHRRRARWS